MKCHYKNLCYTISWVHVFIQQIFDNGIVKIPELGFASIYSSLQLDLLSLTHLCSDLYSAKGFLIYF